MRQDIEADLHQLLLQSSDTANSYMLDAVSHIDRLFGKGFATEHLTFVLGFMNVAQADFSASMQKLSAQDIRDGLRDIATSLEPK